MPTSAERSNYPSNWLLGSSIGLQEQFPQFSKRASYITERLAALFLKRLNAKHRNHLVELLADQAPDSLCANLKGDADRSIGYTDFIQQARLAIRFCQTGQIYTDEEEDLWARRVADSLLSQLGQALKTHLSEATHTELTRTLPGDLRTKLELTSKAKAEATAKPEATANASRKSAAKLRFWDRTH